MLSIQMKIKEHNMISHIYFNEPQNITHYGEDKVIKTSIGKLEVQEITFEEELKFSDRTGKFLLATALTIASLFTALFSAEFRNLWKEALSGKKKIDGLLLKRYRRFVLQPTILFDLSF